MDAPSPSGARAADNADVASGSRVASLMNAFRRKGIEDKGQSLNRRGRHAAGRAAEASEPIGGECQALGLPSLGMEIPGSREQRKTGGLTLAT
jgi:hypothetical protein